MTTIAPAVEAGDKKSRRRRITLTRFPEKDSFQDLVRIAGEALRFFPPLYLRSIFGPPRTWPPPHRELSEFKILDLRQGMRAARFLTAVSVPSIPREPPALLQTLIPSFLNDLFWRPTSLFEHPDPFGEPPASRASERWFFINGICTDSAVARLNATLLARLFGRPLTVVQNATNSLGLDLVECAIGKGFLTAPDLADEGTFTEPSLKTTIAILETLHLPAVKRVVVIAHSQGTIITANVLRAVIKALWASREALARAGLRSLGADAARKESERVAESLTVGVSDRRQLALRHALAAALQPLVKSPQAARQRVKKLEIYTFANCADKMKYAFRQAGRGYPWIEHFANEHDLVARLGVLAPSRNDPQQEQIDIDGPVYVKRGVGWMRQGSWGHLLNEHHLFDIADHLDGLTPNPYPPVDPKDPEPRLYGYFAGGPPSA